MRKSVLWSRLSLFLCLALLAAAVLSTGLAETTAETAADTAEESVILMTGTEDAPVVIGNAHVFRFCVTDLEGTQSWFEIHTDAETVGAALLENGLIAGSDSEYGLYVTSVCGTEIIWSDDNPHYWAFYVNGEYAQTGVDSTPVDDTAVYMFKAE